MKEIKVGMKDVEIQGVFICKDGKPEEIVDESEINNLNGKDVTAMLFTLSSDVSGMYLNTDLSCFDDINSDYMDYEKNSDITYNFSIHHNKGGDSVHDKGDMSGTAGGVPGGMVSGASTGTVDMMSDIGSTADYTESIFGSYYPIGNYYPGDHFSIYNDNAPLGDYYPSDHFSIYNAPLADKGINYSQDERNLELTFEMKDDFQSILYNNQYDFSVEYNL